MTRRRADPRAVAAVAQRLAVLLAAGVPPRNAWEYLDGAPTVDAVRTGLASGLSVDRAILRASAPSPESAAWLALAAVWAIAASAGAPLAPTLSLFAETQRDLAQTERDVAVALAGPVATARLVLALPIVGVLFGYALGFDTISTLVGTPAGWGCLAVGAGLVGVGFLWNRRLVRGARPSDATPGLLLDLVAMALGGGGAPDAAVPSVHRAIEDFGVSVAADSTLDRVLDLSRRAGVPAAELLRAEAEERRRGARAAARIRAERLAVRLMLPLGVCVLPSFVVLSVVPLLLTIVGRTSFGS